MMDATNNEFKWQKYIDPDWIRALDSTPFLTRCRSGQVTRRELDSFVRQHRFYSKHFTRYLCSLLSNIQGDKERLALCENLFEEMGLGDFGNIPHSLVYTRMMNRLGIRMDDEEVFFYTSELVDLMYECCRNENPILGLGALCLGAEAIVPHIYSQVVAGFIAIGESDEDLDYFLMHIEGDEEHAETMLKIISNELKKSPDQIKELSSAAFNIITARTRFLEGISEPELQLSLARGAIHV